MHKNEDQKYEKLIAILGIAIAIVSMAAIIKTDPQLIHPTTLRIIAAIVVLLVILLYAAVYKPKVIRSRRAHRIDGEKNGAGTSPRVGYRQDRNKRGR